MCFLFRTSKVMTELDQCFAFILTAAKVTGSDEGILPFRPAFAVVFDILFDERTAFQPVAKVIDRIRKISRLRCDISALRRLADIA